MNFFIALATVLATAIGGFVWLNVRRHARLLQLSSDIRRTASRRPPERRAEVARSFAEVTQDISQTLANGSR